jgi:hypothetical protein
VATPDFELAHGPRVFTSTDFSNVRMQRLLRHHVWAPCGMLNGSDEGDPEIYWPSIIGISHGIASGFEEATSDPGFTGNDRWLRRRRVVGHGHRRIAGLG